MRELINEIQPFEDAQEDALNGEQGLQQWNVLMEQQNARRAELHELQERLAKTRTRKRDDDASADDTHNGGGGGRGPTDDAPEEVLQADDEQDEDDGGRDERVRKNMRTETSN